MMTPIWKAAILSIALAGLFSVEVTAQDRTLDEFKEYVKGVAGDRINDDQLGQLAKAVDKDGDGNISEAEFGNRMEAFQKIMSEEAEEPKNQSDGNNRRPRDGNSSRGNRWEEMNRRMQRQLDNAGISPGKPLPEVEGLDIEGEPFKLADLKGHYSVIVSGCLT